MCVCVCVFLFCFLSLIAAGGRLRCCGWDGGRRGGGGGEGSLRILKESLSVPIALMEESLSDHRRGAEVPFRLRPAPDPCRIPPNCFH